MKKILYSFLLCCFSFSTFKAIAQPSFIKDSLDNYIQKGIKDWDIPGLAIAVIKNGKVVVMKGFGVKNIKTKEPVDENTLFMIASNSKLFTGTALAQLDYDKKLSLNDKITKYFPDYKAYEQTTTDLVTIKDMLSHKFGTKTFQGDFSFWNSNNSRQEIMRKMRLLKPTGLFRQDYGYCNSCFLTAGQVIPQVTGKPWEVYIYDSIFAPLGMTNTSALGRGIEQMPNVATPYTTSFSGTLQELEYDRVDNLAPAGSIVSCVKDVAKWLTMQLDSGRYQGKQIFPWPVIRKTRDINNAISSRKSGTLPTHFTGYGLGVFMTDYNGKQVYWHTGGADGFVTNTCFVPEEGLAITILTNQDNQSFFEALRYQILDAYLNVPYVNRGAAMLPGFIKSNKETNDQINNWKARLKGNHPSLPPTAYIGTYTNELYGSITISQNNTGLSIKFNSHDNLTASLQYMDNDEWLLTYSNIAFGIFKTKFKIDNNKITSLEVKVNDFLEYDPYTFVKQ